MAFMPFVTAGDPDLPTTARLVRELAARGADLIEVGFPYSDPIADGPVIQASYTRALAKHLHVRDIFAAIKTVTADVTAPLIGMVSFAIIFRLGPEKFVQKARDAGFAGLIVPDLPGDEAEELAAIARSHGLDLIELIAPTTPPERADRILRTASGFVYCIGVAGTTGVRESLASDLTAELQRLRGQTDLPLAVGFGISRPEQVTALRGVADGVIVGSAVVRHLEDLTTNAAATETVVRRIGDFAATMADAAHAR